MQVDIAGAGIIGLTTALTLADRGHAVTVHDPAPASGASHHAGGMLAPTAEVVYKQDPLFPLMRTSAEWYPELIALTARYTDLPTGYRTDGTLVVARDIAHAKLQERLDRGEGLPQYIKDHPVYYAGPAKTPEGMPTGSFGPTTAGRMDSYVEQFQAAGGSLVMLAKGNRSKAVTNACKQYGGFYLGSVGGPAARLAQDCIRKVEVLEYPELGMEAVWKIEVVDFPAFIVVDDKGNDFYEGLE